MRRLAALLALAGLALAAPALADDQGAIRDLLARYIAASNARDPAAILAVFDRDVSYLDIVRRPEPTLLDRPAFEAEVPLLIRDWQKYDLAFSLGDIRRLTVTGDTAEATFVLVMRGRWLVVPFTRRILKTFTFIRRDSGWAVLEDRGEWLR